VKRIMGQRRKSLCIAETGKGVFVMSTKITPPRLLQWLRRVTAAKNKTGDREAAGRWGGAS